MLKQYYPGAYCESVFSIDFQKLYDMGYRGLIFDVDNTLVHHGDDSNEAVDDLFRKLHAMGFKTLLLSNNSAERLERFKRNIDTQYIDEAAKPLPDAYHKAVRMLGIEKSQALCIGDQIFTDILGANRSGIDSILVHYIQINKKARIGVKRYLEKAILIIYGLRRSNSKLGPVSLTQE